VQKYVNRFMAHCRTSFTTTVTYSQKVRFMAHPVHICNYNQWVWMTQMPGFCTDVSQLWVKQTSCSYSSHTAQHFI